MGDRKSEKDSKDYNVRAVERAMQILNSFDGNLPEMGVSEIGQAVGLHKATVHRIVMTLLNYGYLERTEDGQKYRLGIRLAALGSRVIRRMDLRSEALPCMEKLVQQWNEACDLGIFDQGKVFYIEVLRDNHALTISSAVGQRLPAHCTASGKLFLAHLSSEELYEFLSQPLESYTTNTITSPEELRLHLETTRQNGYGFDDEEFEVGIRAVAAPIFNPDGTVIGVLAIPSPTRRMTQERIPKIVKALKEAAKEISHRMGWTQ